VRLRLDGYEGPLELLLELARGHRVDLTRSSIVALMDQFVTAVAAIFSAARPRGYPGQARAR